ncbi:MAG: capsular polysaccharide biosynthesis protein [Moraxella sp.]|nr:capsular polysaccharide biosynthesis protein [Moraxella sp.]
MTRYIKQLPSLLISAGRGIVDKNPLLPLMLNTRLDTYHNWIKHWNKQNSDCAMVGWGRKPSFDKAKSLANKHSLPLLTLEDGFLRSVGNGKIGAGYGLSVIADDVGVYFDTRSASRLECLIVDNIQQWTADKQTRSTHLIHTLTDNQLSKYNHSTTTPNLTQLADNDNPHILIIDQVANDSSIVGAGATADSFIDMVKQACTAYPAANIWLKTHPASNKGYLAQLSLADYPSRVRHLREPANAIALLQQATAVYTVSSHMGFEALMLGKTVHMFGVAWYAGFGLTDDTHAPKAQLHTAQQRRLSYIWSNTAKSNAAQSNITQHNTAQSNSTQFNNDSNDLAPTLNQLFYAAYIDYSYYGDPACMGVNTGNHTVACEIETAIDWLITNRTWHTRLAGRMLSYEFSRWKRDFVQAFTSFDSNTIISKTKPVGLMNKLLTDYADTPVVRTCKQTYDAWQNRQLHQPCELYLTWGMPSKQRLQTHLPHAPIWCMEDGFIRSQGLGASLIAPLSVVLDNRGIYYDVGQPSDLEHLLTTLICDDDKIAKAHALIDKLTTLRITKYNVGNTKNLHQLISTDKPIHLVVGQVEDDASVKSCLATITTNQALLADVRRLYPNDYIIYKPHPDVEAGLRTGIVHNAQDLADFVAHNIALPNCLDVCDTLHTISSLSGFEALLRGKRVVCYGLPFYAGFGLTSDIVETDNTAKQQALARRHRTLSLAELVYIALIAYPVYRLPNGVGLAQAHQVVDYLAYCAAHPISPTWQAKLKARFMQCRHQLQGLFKK